MSEISIPGTSLKFQNIFCIGRNYSEHAKELNNPIPTSPVVFIKPTSSLCFSGENLVIPTQSNRVDHEVEIVIVIGKQGKNISEAEASSYVSHIGIGLDFTARDLQDKAKEKALPWSIAKGFDTFAAVGQFIKFNGNPEILKNISFSLEINGEKKQVGKTSDMIFTIPYLISYLSSIFTFSPGDIIFTGTPSGVGPVQEGDKMIAYLEGIPSLSLGVIKA